ncbi:MAG: hypothetical protein RLZZ292_3040 [Bacteroidota bacterium]|jgi:hypothetical protein
MSNQNRLIFSGHDTFACRSLWLKKGFDFVLNNGSFNSPDAVVTLGVGKNMVSSIRYWMRAFDILDNEDNLTTLAQKLLADDGWDPYLEDEGSLWLLHYHLVKKKYATTYSLIFNKLRKEKIEFSKQNFISFIKKNFELNISTNTLGDDFTVFSKMYLNDSTSKDKEDIIGGLLTELNLVKIIKRGKEEIYVIEDTEKTIIPDALCYYAIAENENYGQSISLQTIATELNSFGAIFAVNQTGIVNKFENLMSKYDNEIVYKDDAGIKEIQFKTQKRDPFSILNDYYNAK